MLKICHIVMFFMITAKIFQFNTDTMVVLSAKFLFLEPYDKIHTN